MCEYLSVYTICYMLYTVHYTLVYHICTQQYNDVVHDEGYRVVVEYEVACSSGMGVGRAFRIGV